MKVYEELISELGSEQVNTLMMQHLMLSLSKAMKYDEIVNAVDNPKCTIEDIKEVLKDDGDEME